MSMEKMIEVSKSRNVVYEINIAERTIKATIYCDKNEPENLFKSICTKYINGYGIGVVIPYFERKNKFQIKTAYTGIAKCHEDDTFDVHFGKALALERAKEKYHRSMSRSMTAMFDWLDTLHTVVWEYEKEERERWYESMDNVYFIEQKARE